MPIFGGHPATIIWFLFLTDSLFSAAPCIRKPQNIGNGRVRFYRHEHGDLAKYSCYPGYKLKGLKAGLKYKYIRCENGNWTDTPLPECEAGIELQRYYELESGTNTLVGQWRH